jgi:uncharacterized protein (DUF2235 family)
MPRNLILLADGTGQKGGLSPQELGSNIWKIFLGSSPNGTISEADQVVFYDPGIGAAPLQGAIIVVRDSLTELRPHSVTA